MQGWIIEFFGSSGVGKTTFVDGFTADHSAQWTTTKSFDRSLSYPSTVLHELLFQHKTRELVSETKDPFLRRIGRAEIIARVVTCDLAALAALPQPAMLDGGLLKFFGPKLMALHETAPTEVKRFLDKRAFVNLTGRPETILTFARKRQEATGERLIYDRLDSDQEIHEYINQNIQLQDRLCKFLAAEGCPVLKLETEQPESEKNEALNEFLQSLGGFGR